jgi:hypothetical protein
VLAIDAGFDGATGALAGAAVSSKSSESSKVGSRKLNPGAPLILEFSGADEAEGGGGFLADGGGAPFGLVGGFDCGSSSLHSSPLSSSMPPSANRPPAGFPPTPKTFDGLGVWTGVETDFVGDEAPSTIPLPFFDLNCHQEDFPPLLSSSMLSWADQRLIFGVVVAVSHIYEHPIFQTPHTNKQNKQQQRVFNLSACHCFVNHIQSIFRLAQAGLQLAAV